MPAITKRSTFPPFIPATDEGDGFGTLMRRMFNEPVGSLGRSLLWSPSVEVTDSPDAMVLTAELPGMSDDDITLRLENNVLTIAGEKKSEREVREEDERYLLSERFYGAFQRAFTLPSSVDADQIKAAFDHGVLTVTLPKTAQAKGRVISVKSKGK
jgi:HSP20 family protein